MKGNLDVALKELDKVVKVFSQKSFPDKIAKTFIEGAGKPMSKWSWGNQLLVYIQNTTDARGRKMWLKKGRTIISEDGKR